MWTETFREVSNSTETMSISLHSQEKDDIFHETSYNLRELWFDISHNGRKTIEWNSDVWKISIIKQIHNDFTDPDKIREEEPFRYLSLIRYQENIYRELENQNATDVFIEGIREVQYLRWDWDMMKKTLIVNLSDPSFRKQAFADYGGAIIYLVEHPDAHPHFTESDDIWMEMAWYTGEELPSVLVEKRENFVIEQARDFLDENPGKHIHIVFGALHNFEDNIESHFPKHPPQIEVISFPEIAKEYIERSWLPRENE